MPLNVVCVAGPVLVDAQLAYPLTPHTFFSICRREMISGSWESV